MSRSNLPFVSSNIPPDLRRFLDRVRESLDGNTYVRRTDYIYGTVPRLPGEPPGGGGGGGDDGGGTLPCGNPVTPTAPTGLEVAAGFSGFLLSWNMPAYCGHDHTEVYALRRNAGASELSEVNLIGDSRGAMYSHVVNQADDYWCFWIRHVNTAGVKGPFNNTPGTCARTVIPPEVLIDALKGRITESQLYKHLGDRIDLIELTKTAVETETLVREEADRQLAVRIDTVSAVANNAAAGVTDITTARIGYCTKNGVTTDDPDKTSCIANGGTWNLGLPWATAVKQVSVTYNGQSVALEQQFNAIASDVNGLEAQYTVKIDNNGYVSGFGLASTPVNGVPFSDFIIRADRFSIGAPADPDAGYQNDPSIPFIVTTTGQTINGVYVPPGTYIKDVYIQNGTITNAKIANATIDNAKIISLSVDKLTTGSLAVGQCISSQGFVSGSSGWQICASGNAEFNNILARGTLRSNNWNGALDSNNVIAANGTQGWVIDKNGNAEFDTVHIRKNAISTLQTGTQWQTTGTVSWRFSALLDYVDITYPDVSTTGVFLLAQIALERAGQTVLGAGSAADATVFILREWPVASDPANLVNGGICSRPGYTTATSCATAGGTWFTTPTYCHNFSQTTKTACSSAYWNGTPTIASLYPVASLDIKLPLVRPGDVSIAETDLAAGGNYLPPATLAFNLTNKINNGLTTNALFWGQHAGFAQDLPTFTAGSPPLFTTGDTRRRVRYWLAVYNVGGNSPGTSLYYHAHGLSAIFVKR